MLYWVINSIFMVVKGTVMMSTDRSIEEEEDLCCLLENGMHEINK